MIRLVWRTCLGDVPIPLPCPQTPVATVPLEPRHSLPKHSFTILGCISSVMNWLGQLRVFAIVLCVCVYVCVLCTRSASPNAKARSIYKFACPREVEVVTRCCRVWIDDGELQPEAIALAERVLKVGSRLAWSVMHAKSSTCAWRCLLCMLTAARDCEVTCWPEL